MISLSFLFMFVFGWLPLLLLIFRAKHYLKHPEKYNMEKRFFLAKKFVRVCEICTNTRPRFFGHENLPPEDTGYLMVANHQGKYDALAVMSAFEYPMSILMEINQSNKPGARHVMDLIDGERIDLNRPRQQLRIIRSMGEKVRGGAHFLVFPEGGYSDNGNSIQNFHNGCFFSAYLARSPIVPICLVDTRLSMNRNNIFRRVRPEVHILPPIPYEVYKDLSREETANLVRERMIAEMTRILSERGKTYVPRDEDAPIPKAALREASPQNA